MDKLFKEGFTFGENKSTGLGLFLIRKTMERYGGRIAALENQPHEARFVLSFPAKDALS
jgi:signal transduction histidine kinase